MASSSDLSELEDDNSEGGDEASDAEAETEKWSTQVPEFLALLARKDEIFDLRRRNDDGASCSVARPFFSVLTLSSGTSRRTTEEVDKIGIPLFPTQEG